MLTEKKQNERAVEGKNLKSETGGQKSVCYYQD